MSSPLQKVGKPKLQELCLLSLMGALMLVSQIALSGLPNIHILAPMIIICAVCFGWKSLYAVFVFILLEALVWGLGLWVISYGYLWPLLAAAAVLLRKSDSPLFWAVLAGIHGLLFGAGCALPYLLIGGWEMAFSYWVAGIPYDFIHCASNFVTTLVLYRPLIKVLRHCMRKTGSIS